MIAEEVYINMEDDPYWWTEFEDPEEKAWREAGCPEGWWEEDDDE